MTDGARELVERLRRKERRFPATGGGSIGRDADGKTTSTSYITDDGYRLVNPDGPEAADFIEQSLTPPEGDTVSDEVVERVARAIYASHGKSGTWEYLPETVKNLWRGDARAAIAALQSRPAVDPYAHRDGSRECRPASRVSPQAGVREALEKCRAKFAEYVKLHSAKLHDGTPTQEWLAVSKKVERNQEMVDLCDAALSTAPPTTSAS